MNNAFLSNNFAFINIKFKNSHYTDNKKGSPINYLARLIKGRARLISEDTVITITEGDVFYIPMNLPYESYWSGEEIEWDSFGFTYFPEGEYKKYKIQKINCDQETKQLIASIPKPISVTSKALGAFFTALGKLLPLMELDSKNDNERIFEQAKKLMQKQIELSIHEIAKGCNVSTASLYNIFKSCCGKTPNTIKQEILTEKAILMLTTTDKSVQEISDSLGFSSTSYFRKVLKLHTAQTPRQIRKDSVV